MMIKKFIAMIMGSIMLILGLILFGADSALAGGYYSDGIYMPDGVCMDCGDDDNNAYSDDNSYSGPSRSEIRRQEEETERLERNARYDATHQAAYAAWERNDYQEVLRLLLEQQSVRDGPNVRADIENVNAQIVWHAATTAADYRRAIAMKPSVFTQENIRYVEELEAKEQYERERPAREAQAERDRIVREAEDLKVAAKMSERISQFALSLDTAAPKAGIVAVQGDVLGDAMGTHKAEKLLEFGDPNALEAHSEQKRQGFDNTDGPLAGTPIELPRAPVMSGESTADRDPRMIAATQEMNALQAERDQIDADIARLTQERNTAADAEKMKALTAILDQKNQAKQDKLVQISQSKEKTGKLRRTINTQVEAKNKKSKSAAAKEKK